MFSRRNRTKAAQQAEDELESYEVRKLLDHRYSEDGQLEYLISWKGYGPESDSWEPIEHINNTALIKKYNLNKRTEALKLSVALDDRLTTSIRPKRGRPRTGSR